VDAVSNGDGVTWAQMKLTGSKQNLDLRLTVDSRGKVVDAVLRPGA
jgi:hypothetical protein